MRDGERVGPGREEGDVERKIERRGEELDLPVIELLKWLRSSTQLTCMATQRGHDLVLPSNKGGTAQELPHTG